MSIGTRLVFLFSCMLWAGAFAWGQSFVPGELTDGFQQVEDLSGYWYTSDEEELFLVPFVEDRSELDLVHPLQVKPSLFLADTLYLYFEGVAWTSEIYLNERLLAITRDPFGEHLLPIPQDLLINGKNLLRVKMRSEGPDHVLSPQKFLGIYRNCFLLAPSPKRTLVPRQKWIDRTEKALIYAPWSASSGYLEDTLGFIQMMDKVIGIGNPHVYYAFEPPQSYRKIAARKGIRRLVSLDGCDSVAFLNAYPVQVMPRNAHPWFWIDEEGKMTLHVMQYQSWKTPKVGLSNPPDRIALLLFLMIPLLGLVLLKFVGPKTWSFLIDYLIKVKFFLDLIRNGKFLKSLSSILINIYGVVLFAVCLSVFLYFLQSAGRLEPLNILSSESILYQIMVRGNYSLPQLFLASLIFLMVLAGVKTALSALFSLLYGINTLTQTLQNLEIISTFPLNILLLLPTGALFFIQPEMAWVAALAWQIIFLIILIRKVIIQYAGLSYIFDFSVSLKILYICGLEIMPWVLLV